MKLNIPANQNFCLDLKTKLQALGSLDGIILLMSLKSRVTSNFLNTMKGIIYMFENDNKSRLFENLALCYSKCDESEKRTFMKKMRSREKERTEIVAQLKKYGINYSDYQKPEIFFLTAVNESVKSIGQEAEFNSLLKFLQKSGSLSTKSVKDIFPIIRGILDLQ